MQFGEKEKIENIELNKLRPGDCFVFNDKTYLVTNWRKQVEYGEIIKCVQFITGAITNFEPNMLVTPIELVVDIYKQI